MGSLPEDQLNRRKIGSRHHALVPRSAANEAHFVRQNLFNQSHFRTFCSATKSVLHGHLRRDNDGTEQQVERLSVLLVARVDKCTYVRSRCELGHPVSRHIVILDEVPTQSYGSAERQLSRVPNGSQRRPTIYQVGRGRCLSIVL